MLRIFIILICLSITTPATALSPALNAVVSFTGTAATTSWCDSTCTGSTGANIFCEDFESNQTCVASGDTNCRCAWTEASMTGGTADYNVSAPGTYPCSGTTNNYVMKLDKTNDTSTRVQVTRAWTATNGINVKFWLYVGAEGLANSGQIEIIRLNGAGYQLVNGYLYKTSGGQLQIGGRYRTDNVPSYSTAQFTNVSTGVWYKISISYNVSGAVSFTVDSTSVFNNTTASTQTVDTFGLGTPSNDTETFTLYVDNIKLDSSSMPGDCS